jgi:S1-C subfamily serine protease
LSERTAGILVVGVATDGPGQRAGILPGDIVLSFGRSKLVNTDPTALKRLAEATAPGTLVPIVLQRDGRTIQIRLAVAAKPPVVNPAALNPPPAGTPRPLPPPPAPPKPVREQDIVFPK